MIRVGNSPLLNLQHFGQPRVEPARVHSEASDSTTFISEVRDNYESLISVRKDLESFSAKLDAYLPADFEFGVARARSSSAIGLTAEEATLPLSRVAEFQNIEAGTVFVNDASFEIQPERHSLNDVVSLLDNIKKGMTASYDGDSDRVTLESPGLSFQLRSGETGLFEAINLSDASYDAQPLRHGLARQDVTDALARVSTSLNSFFSSGDISDDLAETMRARFQGAAAQNLGNNGEVATTGMGITLDLRPDAEQMFSFGTAERERFDDALKDSPRELRGKLDRGGFALRESPRMSGLPPDTGDGLFRDMIAALRSAEDNIHSRFGHLGLVVAATA